MKLLPRPDLLVCAECDAVYQRRRLAAGQRLRCQRCGATLGVGHWLSADGQLALTLAALVVLVIASTNPIVTLDLGGNRSVATFFEAIGATWASGEHLVAALAAATAFVFPLAVVLLRVWVLLPMLRHHPLRGFVPAMRALRFALRWSMVEVFLIGVLIAVVRSAGVSHVVAGPGMLAYVVLVVLIAAIQSSGMHALWELTEDSQAMTGHQTAALRTKPGAAEDAA